MALFGVYPKSLKNEFKKMDVLNAADQGRLAAQVTVGRRCGHGRRPRHKTKLLSMSQLRSVRSVHLISYDSSELNCIPLDAAPFNSGAFLPLRL